MEDYKKHFDTGRCRKLTKEYISIQNKEYRLRKALSGGKLLDERVKATVSELKTLRQKRISQPCSNPMDKNYKRIFYQRYADDFLIGIIGSKQDAETVKADIGEYLSQKLQLELSLEKTLVTHGKQWASFLGYNITIGKKGTPNKDKNGVLADRHNGKVKLYVPHNAWFKKLQDCGALKIISSTNQRDVWKPCHRNELLYLPDQEIIRRVNWEIQGLYQYHKLADNVSVLNNYYHIMKYSTLKTLACKHNCTIPKIMGKHYVNGHFEVRYTKDGVSKAISMYDGGFRYQKICNIPIAKKHASEMLTRIKQRSCEWCGHENTDVNVHQVRKLSNLTGIKEWEVKMLEMNRKTLVLCEDCHRKLHEGLLD